MAPVTPSPVAAASSRTSLSVTGSLMFRGIAIPRQKPYADKDGAWDDAGKLAACRQSGRIIWNTSVTVA
jgi:hypothetical protein